MSQRLKVALGGAHFGNRGRVLQIHGQLVDGLHGLFAHLLQVAGVGVLDAERVGDVAVLLARVVLVVFHDRGQQNTVGHTVGHAQTAAQRVSHAVHQAEAHVRVGHAGDVGRVGHLLASRNVAIGGLGQVLGNHANGLHGQAVGQAPGTRGNVTLDGVGQGVKSGGDLQAARHRVGQVRIHESDDRDVVRVDGHELTLVGGIGDHVVDGRLGSGTGGGRHAEDRDGRVLGIRDAFQGQHVGELRVGGDDADALAGVLRGAAAQTNQEVRTGLGELGDAVLNALYRRVRLDVGEHLIRQTGLIQNLGDLLGGAGLQQYRISDDKCLGEAVLLGDGRNFLDRATSEVCSLVENHAVYHRDSPFELVS